MDSTLTVLEAITAFHVDVALLPGAVVIFIVGAVLLYKKGSWLGLPLCFSAILLVVVATLAKVLSP
jgi:hypothetical protein